MNHKFWATQNHPISINSTDESWFMVNEEEIPAFIDRKKSLPLNDAYKWCVIDINDPLELSELTSFLSDHYLEAEEFFRYDMTNEHIKWILQKPGYRKDWLLSIKDHETNSIIAFISGSPINLNLHGKNINTAVINLLCIRKIFFY